MHIKPNSSLSSHDTKKTEMKQCSSTLTGWLASCKHVMHRKNNGTPQTMPGKSSPIVPPISWAATNQARQGKQCFSAAKEMLPSSAPCNSASHAHLIESRTSKHSQVLVNARSCSQEVQLCKCIHLPSDVTATTIHELIHIKVMQIPRGSTHIHNLSCTAMCRKINRQPSMCKLHSKHANAPVAACMQPTTLRIHHHKCQASFQSSVGYDFQWESLDLFNCRWKARNISLHLVTTRQCVQL